MLANLVNSQLIFQLDRVTIPDLLEDDLVLDCSEVQRIS